MRLVLAAGLSLCVAAATADFIRGSGGAGPTWTWTHYWTGTPGTTTWVDSLNAVPITRFGTTSATADGLQILDATGGGDLDTNNANMLLNLQSGGDAFTLVGLFTITDSRFNPQTSARIISSYANPDGFEVIWANTAGGYAINSSAGIQLIETTPSPGQYPLYRCAVLASTGTSGTWYWYDMDTEAYVSRTVSNAYAGMASGIIGFGNWPTAFITRGMPGTINGIGVAGSVLTVTEALEACNDLEALQAAN